MPSRLGAYLTAQRRARNLSPQQLAAAVAYRNLAKGGNRILALERGDRTDHNLLAKVAAALRLDPAHVDALAQADRRARDEAWHAWSAEPVEPELRVRVIPAIWCRVPLADGLSRKEAEMFARTRAVQHGLVHVLAWSRREEVWCYEDGRTLTRTVGVGEMAGPVTWLRGRGARGFVFG
jgi:hypothetical protein